MKKILILTLFFVGTLLQSGAAHAFVVDGNLSDWGVTPGLYGASTWTPGAGIQYTVEDQSPSTPGGYLNPGYGGQGFDAEAMYATYDNNNLYFAIVTGKSPGTDLGYRPGDIAFDFGNDGSYEYGIETTGANQGNLYSVNSWGTGLWGTGDPTEMTGNPLLLGSGSLVYNMLTVGGNPLYLGDHYVIEGYIPLSLFGSNWSRGFKMSWTETCGNDVISMNVHTAPEPATMALFGMGLAGLGVLRRRQFKA